MFNCYNKIIIIRKLFGAYNTERGMRECRPSQNSFQASAHEAHHLLRAFHSYHHILPVTHGNVVK